MSVSSPCEICGRADVEDRCDRCGQLVCGEHFDEAMGYCVECAAAVSEKRPAERSEDLPDGVDTYRF